MPFLLDPTALASCSNAHEIINFYLPKMSETQQVSAVKAASTVLCRDFDPDVFSWGGSLTHDVLEAYGRMLGTTQLIETLEQGRSSEIDPPACIFANGPAGSFLALGVTLDQAQSVYQIITDPLAKRVVLNVQANKDRVVHVYLDIECEDDQYMAVTYTIAA